MSSKDKFEAWRGDPLPRGRHKLSADAVRASQRERLLRAMLECVGSQGYADTSVPQVVAAARVSRSSFYAFFEDKTDCFIAACDDASREIVDALMAFGAEEDWVQALRKGMSYYVQWWQQRPGFSRAYFVELPAAGARAVEQRDRAYGRFREMFAALAARARIDQPDLPPLSPVALRLVVAGVTEVVAEEVRGGRLAGLDTLTRDLTYLTLTLLADDKTAERALGRRRLRMAAATR
jgi:AcrR family transcriptional regulator